MTIQEYESYGQKLLLHVPGAERPQFCYVEELGDPKEVIYAAKNALSVQPLLVWEAFEENLNNAGRDNYTSLLTGSLAVLYKTDDSIAGRRQAREQGRSALLALLAQMRDDERDGLLPVAGARIEHDRLPLERVGPLGAGWYGMATSFTWRVPLGSRF